MAPPTKRRRLPFKPPRPVDAPTSASKSGAPSSATKRSKPQNIQVSRSPSPASLSYPAEDLVNRSSSPPESDHNSPRHDIDSLSSEPEYILAEITAPIEVEKESLKTSEPDFPPKLLAALVHRHMKERGEKMRITKDANKLYAKYVDIFVKEAVARAIYERREKLNSDGIQRNRTQTILDSYLEVGLNAIVYPNFVCPYVWHVHVIEPCIMQLVQLIQCLTFTFGRSRI